MSLQTFEDARPWARSIKTRVAARQMPPWHIDKTVGIQHFENDRSLTDEQIDTIVRWVDAGAPQGDPKDMPPPVKWPTETAWEFASQFGQPDLVIKSPAWHMPAQAQDAWYKPIVDTGITEPRWVRAIEIRPATKKGRRITHHALARLKQDDGSDPLQTSADNADTTGGLFMEWAVGKQGELMRPNTGKLLLPGSKIVFDIHYHAVGEDITDSVELGIYFYPKGQEPSTARCSAASRRSPAAKGTSTFPPTRCRAPGLPRDEAGRPHRELPAAHAPARQGDVDGSDSARRRREMLSHVNNFQFNWHLNYIYADDAAPILPKGTILRITAWHDNTTANKGESRSESVGRLGRAHGGRDGARVGEHHLHERRGLQGRDRASAKRSAGGVNRRARANAERAT